MLARTWYGKKTEWVLANHTSAELAELQALYELSPWDEQRSDVQAAMVCAAIRTAMGDKDVKLSDWTYDFDPQPEPVATAVEKLRQRLGSERFEDTRK